MSKIALFIGEIMRISELLHLRQNRIRLNNIRKNRRNIIPFVGAGISVACGLYTWLELLDKLASEYLSSNEREIFKNTTDYFKYAQAIVDASGNQDAVMRRIGEIFEETDICINKTPYLLVSSFSNNIITTNYDTILETAAIKFGNKAAFKTLLPCLTGQMTRAIQDNSRCIMKMHGSVEETSSMIFGEAQYEEFYGRDKPLPMFLETFFGGRSILFVGCSLTKDKTIDVLSKCVNRNSKVMHYAIVELPQIPDEEVKQRNYLSSLGIEPIYYPKGDYESVELLLEYIAEDNSFIKEVKRIFEKYFSIGTDTYYSEDTHNILISILNESYYNTAKDYPELLELDKEKLDIVRAYKAALEISDKIYESLYDTCVNLFDLLSRSGIKSAYDIRESLTAHFADAALRETDIRELLQKQNMLYVPKSLDIEGKSNDELTVLADKLNRKIQFENEMSYRNFMDDYNQAVELLDKAYDRIEMHQRVLLCNTIGAWGTFVLDVEKPKKYLALAISTIESLNDSERPYSLLSQCYCNLGLLMARNGDYKAALEYAKKDVELKKQNCDNLRLYAGSMGLYALYQKELDPFAASRIHVDVIKLKRSNIENADELRYERDKNIDTKTMKHKLIASWATSVFNLGLLAKDLLLYQLADEFIMLANSYRYKIIDNVSKDYNASYNAEIELAVLLHQDQDIQRYISAVKGRMSMDPKLSTTIYHSWYVCALYFYSHADYDVAKQYIRKFYKEYYFKGDVKDVRLEVRAKLLDAKILLKSDSDIKFVQIVLDEAIERLKELYPNESFWFVEPYILYENINDRYSEELIKLKEIYSKKRESVHAQLNQFIREITNAKPSIS